MLIIGHKGAAGLAPGNTIEAIERAIETNVDMIEIDVRISSDGVPVLIHDKSIGSKNVAMTTINGLKVTNNNLTTLDQALKLIDDKSKVLLDIKPDVDPEPILSVINKHKKTDIMVTSFDFKILRYIHNDSPDIELAVLDRWSGVRASYRARKLDTKLIIMNHKWVWGGFIRSFANSGYDLYVYTLDDPKRAKKWSTSGLKGVITDYPDRF